MAQGYNPNRDKKGQFASGVGLGKDSIPTARGIPRVPERTADVYVVSRGSVNYDEYAARITAFQLTPDIPEAVSRPMSAVDRIVRESDFEISKGYGDWTHDDYTREDGKVRRKVSSHNISIERIDFTLKKVTLNTGIGEVTFTFDDNGKLHDTPGEADSVPAVSSTEGSAYYKHGVLHRDRKAGPALIENGKITWVEKGKVIASVDAEGVIRDRKKNPVAGVKLWVLKRRVPALKERVTVTVWE